MKKEIFKKTQRAGIVYVMEQAMKHGFTYSNPDWVNLGQGSADAKHFEGAPDRVRNITINGVQRGYAPVSGLKNLRENVAEMYNKLFRDGKKIKFNYKNVDIAGGGRTCLSRIFLCMERTRVSYLVPDYAGYEGLLSSFNNLKTFPVFLDEENSFKIDMKELDKEFKKNKIDVFLLSNPANPTGNLIRREELKKLMNICKKNNVILVIDEFYFNYIYNGGFELVSSASFVKDIEDGSVIIVSGFSKAWRYAGWRIAWTIASKDIIKSLGDVGSFMDGGTNRPLQEVAVEIANTKNILQESRAIQKHFYEKRDFMIEKLTKMGFVIKNKPQGAFYLWASLENLPEEINEDFKFFEKALEEKVITVPGRFFDINPYKKRKKVRFKKYIRFSYGPDMQSLKKGLSGIERVIDGCKK